MSQRVTEDTSQYADNKSFNPTFQIYENLVHGYDPVTGQTYALAVSANGHLISDATIETGDIQIGNVGVLNVAEDTINPATEDTLTTRVKESATPTVYTVTCTLANTEYSQVLPANTRKITVQLRGAYDSRLAFVTGKVAGSTEPFFTLKNSNVYYEDMINLASQTLYFACGTAGQVIEIICWS